MVHRIVICAPILLAGCLSGSGEIATEARTIDPFTAIVDATVAEVRVAASASSTGTLTCDANLLDSIDTEVTDGVLTVSTPIGVTLEPSGDCYLSVGTDTLTSVETQAAGSILSEGPFTGLALATLSGSGQVRLEHVLGDVITVDVAGTGSMTLEGVGATRIDLTTSGLGPTRLSGTTTTLVVASSGQGPVDAQELAATDVRVDATGTGDVSVSASGTATIRLSGEGDVTVYGGATIDGVDLGDGEIVTP